MAAGRFETIGLTAGYGATRVIEDISFHVSPGGKLTVLGRNGVGKTTLLREFIRMAGREKAAVALTDDNETDIPAAMARLAAGFGDPPGDPFHAFNTRYRTYRQRREELEADPNAPTGLAGLFGRAAVKVGAKALRNTVPASDLVLGFIEDPLADQASQWAEFVRRKLGNRDEAQLVLEPEVALTPLFVQGVNALAAARPVALLFDTYERTAVALDGWLRALLEGRHGNLPANLTLVVAGRHALDRNAWADLEGVMAPLCLEPFSEAEARDYLTRRGVTDERVVAVILSLSGRLPLLLMILANQRPDDPAQIGDATGTAVERFLKWVDDPARRALALNGALPRRLNRDVAALLGGGADAFDWLADNRLIERRPGGEAWTYHEVVREQMLRYKRQEAPGEWAALHDKLADHYAAECKGLDLSWAEGARNERWRAAALGALYHRLCARPERTLPEALNDIAASLDEHWEMAGAWSEVLATAGRDADCQEVQEWGVQLSSGLRGNGLARLDSAIKLASKLIGYGGLGLVQRATALSFRSSRYRMQKRSSEALADLNQAIVLDPQNARLLANRGSLFSSLNRDEEALADYDQAIMLDPRDAWIRFERSSYYWDRGRHDEALRDLDRSVELSPFQTWPILRRALCFMDLQQYDKALVDFEQAIRVAPDDSWNLMFRAIAYVEMGQYADALKDLDQFIANAPTVFMAFNMRGRVWQEIGRYTEALSDFNQVIELAPWYDTAIENRGRTYLLLEQYGEALRDFEHAVERDPNNAWAIASRGETYRLLERHDEALADFDRVIDLDPSDWDYYQRAITRRAIDPASD